MSSIIRLREATCRAACAALVLAVVCAVTLSAQSPEPARDYTSTSQLIGARVWLQASPDAIAEASGNPERVGRTKAIVTEWLIDSSNGKLAHAVVRVVDFPGIGDKIVLVPVGDLKWNEGQKRHELGWTKDQLQARPAFDLDAATKAGLDKACAFTMSVKAATKQPANASTTREVIAGTGLVAPTNFLCKASEMASTTVHTGAMEWGVVRDLIVDREQNRVVLAVVNHGAKLGVGGTDHLLRTSKLHACRDKDGNRLLCTQLTPEELSAEVRYEKPKSGVVDPAVADAVLSKSECSD